MFGSFFYSTFSSTVLETFETFVVLLKVKYGPILTW